MGLKDENKKLSVEVAALRKRLKEKEIYELGLIESNTEYQIQIDDLQKEVKRLTKKNKELEEKILYLKYTFERLL